MSHVISRTISRTSGWTLVMAGVLATGLLVTDARAQSYPGFGGPAFPRRDGFAPGGVDPLAFPGGTTVQLPSFGFTTVNTTVSAPDGGTALLGGIKRASEGRVERGVPILGKVPGVNRLFKNNAIGRQVGGFTMTVTPRIIIQEEEEQKLGLQTDGSVARAGSPRAGDGPRADPALAARADFLMKNLARNEVVAPVAAPTVRPAPTPEELERRNQVAQDSRDAEALTLLERARKLDAEGNAGAARVYYGMAARRLSGSLREEAETRLSALSGKPGNSRLAARP